MENPKSWAVQKIAPEFPLGSLVVHNEIKVVFKSQVNSYAPKSCSDIFEKFNLWWNVLFGIKWKLDCERLRVLEGHWWVYVLYFHKQLPPLNSCCRKICLMYVNLQICNATTIWNSLQPTDSRKNSCYDNYLQKYGRWIL